MFVDWDTKSVSRTVKVSTNERIVVDSEANGALASESTSRQNVTSDSKSQLKSRRILAGNQAFKTFILISKSLLLANR